MMYTVITHRLLIWNKTTRNSPSTSLAMRGCTMLTPFISTFGNCPLLKNQIYINILVKSVYLAENWLIEISEKKKTTKNINIFDQMLQFYLLQYTVWSFPFHFPLIFAILLASNCFSLFLHNLLEERSICDRFCYLESYCLENSLKRVSCVFLTYLVVISSLFLIIIICLSFFSQFPCLLVALWSLS